MITAVKGMNDILPAGTDEFLRSAPWRHVETLAAKLLEAHGYKPVWLPLVEDTALFARGIGADTDIVSKEMYSFSDRGERSLTLRPEGTAGAARAYIEHHFSREAPVQKWWYHGPMFRAERPQKGRYRQFYQIGAEFFGVADVAADVEMMQMLHTFTQHLQIPEVTLRLNSLGDADSRAAFRATLIVYLSGREAELCASCKARLHTNPLRVLDCKRPTCRAIAAGAPDIRDSLTAPCRANLDRACDLLTQNNVPYVRDPHLVRGLDYYTEVIFEFVTGALGAQDTIIGGGRYNNLVADLGGPPTPAVGFAAGVERLALVAGVVSPPLIADLYIVPMGDEAVAYSLGLASALRTSGLKVDVDLVGDRIKHQMRRADRSSARAVLVLGPDELSSGTAKLKDLTTRTERVTALQAEDIGAGFLALSAGQPSGPMPQK